MIYLTVNDAPSGVYKSQVVDVVKYLNELSEEQVQLICLISIRGFKSNKKKIKSWYPTAKVYPMIPRLANWQRNYLILNLIKGIRNEPIIARGPIACSLALRLNERVCYDGRGAVKAELNEFQGIIQDEDTRRTIIEAERESVKNSSFRIAVSNKLVNFWQKEFHYNCNDHVVIPCTLSESALQNPSERSVLIQNLGWDEQDTVLVYSGGGAGWQSFNKVANLLERWINELGVKVLFLTKENPQIDSLLQKFPESVKQLWLKPEEVSSYLQICDYGILIRNRNVTNQVASPVKFAEYLAAGLKILISPDIGDYSELVAKSGLGIVVNDTSISLEKIGDKEKMELRKFAIEHFTKESYKKEYKKLVNFNKR